LKSNIKKQNICYIIFCLKAAFAVVPTDKISGRSLSSKSPLLWTAYLWNCMSHDKRDL